MTSYSNILAVVEFFIDYHFLLCPNHIDCFSVIACIRNKLFSSCFSFEDATDRSPTPPVNQVNSLLYHVFLHLKRVCLGDVTSIMSCYGSTSLTQNQDSDVVNYAAVSFTTNKSSSSRRQRAQTSREDAEYSEVRYLQQERDMGRTSPHWTETTSIYIRDNFEGLVMTGKITAFWT